MMVDLPMQEEREGRKMEKEEPHPATPERKGSPDICPKVLPGKTLDLTSGALPSRADTFFLKSCFRGFP